MDGHVSFYILVSKTLLMFVLSGFGKHMINTQMVIVWKNRSNATSISQRITEHYREPHVVRSPPRRAFVEDVTDFVSAVIEWTVWSITRTISCYRSGLHRIGKLWRSRFRGIRPFCLKAIPMSDIFGPSLKHAHQAETQTKLSTCTLAQVISN